MNIAKVKTFKPAVLPILALSLLPLTAKAQTTEKISAQTDTISVAVMNKNLQEDVFQKKDTTALNISNVDQTVQTSDNNQEITKDVIKTNVKEKTKGFITDPDTKKAIGINATYGTNIPGVGVGANLNFYNDKFFLGVDVLAAKNDQKSVMGADFYGVYFWNLGNGFCGGPKIGITKGKVSHKDLEIENSNIIAPKFDAIFKYIKDFNAVKLIATLEGGGAVVLAKVPGSTEYETSYTCQKVDVEFMAKLAAQCKNIIFFVNGGKDINKGYNIGGGIDFEF